MVGSIPNAPLLVYSFILLNEGVSGPKLYQQDLLGSLRTLATLRFDDVLMEIISGLFDLLQVSGYHDDLSPPGLSGS
jgi:hypothetical protein